MITEEFKGLEKEINEDIYAFCERYVQEATMRAEEYKRAFLDTGGTKEEWEAHEITVKVWYEVKSQTDRYLSVAVKGTENWSSSYSEELYYNLDLETGRWITLQDILGKDYKSIVDKSILSQIALKEEGEEVYWPDEWKGINENTKFYMNQNQNPVIVLDKYEIAPGAAGRQEFEIREEVEQGQGAATAYMDNFAVDEEVAVAYARRIKEASLRPSMAGFTLSGENGAPSITFGVQDGKLGISGINY